MPAYAVFTNEQLATMVRRRVTTVADLGEIDGVGKSRIQKYAAPFLEILRNAPAPETTDGQA